MPLNPAHRTLKMAPLKTNQTKSCWNCLNVDSVLYVPTGQQGCLSPGAPQMWQRNAAFIMHKVWDTSGESLAALSFLSSIAPHSFIRVMVRSGGERYDVATVCFAFMWLINFWKLYHSAWWIAKPLQVVSNGGQTLITFCLCQQTVTDKLMA